MIIMHCSCINANYICRCICVCVYHSSVGNTFHDNFLILMRVAGVAKLVGVWKCGCVGVGLAVVGVWECGCVGVGLAVVGVW